MFAEQQIRRELIASGERFMMCATHVFVLTYLFA